MKHPVEIEGFAGSVEDAAKAIAQMRYDYIARFLKALADEFRKQAVGDKNGGRIQLAALLTVLVSILDAATGIMESIWRLCKKYM